MQEYEAKNFLNHKDVALVTLVIQLRSPCGYFMTAHLAKYTFRFGAKKAALW